MAKDNKNVIRSMPEPATWTFMSFVTSSGREVADNWDTEKSFAAELAFNSMVKNNSKISDHMAWPAWRHKMDKDAGKAGVIELEFTSDKPYRVLCKFNGKKCIVVLCICYHKGKVWNPVDAVGIATERAKLLAAGKAKLNVIQIEDNL